MKDKLYSNRNKSTLNILMWILFFYSNSTKIDTIEYSEHLITVFAKKTVIYVIIYAIWQNWLPHTAQKIYFVRSLRYAYPAANDKKNNIKTPRFRKAFNYCFCNCSRIYTISVRDKMSIIHLLYLLWWENLFLSISSYYLFIKGKKRLIKP